MKNFKKCIFAFVSAISMLFSCANVYAENAFPNGYAAPPQTEAPEAPVGQASVFRDDSLSLFAEDIDFSMDENGRAAAVINSYDENNFCRAVTNGTKIKVSGIYTDENYDMVWPYITNSASENLLNVGPKTITPGSGFSYDLDLSSLSDGDYVFRVYTKRSGSSSYIMMIKNLALEKSGSSVKFVLQKDIVDKDLFFIEGNYRVPAHYLTQRYYDITVDDEVKKWAEEITAGKTTSYEKIKAVHDWAAENVYYDYKYYYDKSNTTNFDTKDVYKNKYSVCHGYSTLCAGLLRSIGIPCKFVVGYGKGSSSTNWSDVMSSEANHAWNEAWCEEQQRWIVFDSTWDSNNKRDYDSTNRTYLEGNIISGERETTYFDIPCELFGSDHRTDYYAWYVYNEGDVDQDGSYTEKDAALIMKQLSGTGSLSTYIVNNRCDVNGDGKFDFLDSVAAVKKYEFRKLYNANM